MREDGLSPAEEWLTSAASDLAIARLAVSAPDVLPAHVAFHAQQAAEKALKALLLHLGVRFPFTHAIEDLVLRVRAAGLEVPDAVDAAAALTPFAAETRYPGGSDDQPDAAVSAEALRIAEAVLVWVRGTIRGAGADEQRTGP